MWRLLPGGVGGWLAHRPAAVRRGDQGLVFSWGRRAWALDDIAIDHRDDGGRITFRVLRDGSEVVRVRYRRKGPRLRDLVWDFIDISADEPWTWEDRDFGLFAFHVATDTGPVKYRYRFDLPEGTSRPDPDAQRVWVDDEGVRRLLVARRPFAEERIRWDELDEVAVKLEVAGIWADKAIVVLRGALGLCVVPVSSVDGLPEGLRDGLAALPGFGDRALERLDRAEAYARRDWWPRLDRIGDWAEWSLWSRSRA